LLKKIILFSVFKILFIAAIHVQTRRQRTLSAKILKSDRIQKRLVK